MAEKLEQLVTPNWPIAFFNDNFPAGTASDTAAEL